MAYLDQVAASILVLPRAERNRYIDALRQSLLWDHERNRLPVSPPELEGLTGLPISVLFPIGILVGKQAALEFLNERGFRLSKPQVNRKLGKAKFFDALQREPCVDGNINLYTLGEVLCAMNYRRKVPLPENLG